MIVFWMFFPTIVIWLALQLPAVARAVARHLHRRRETGAASRSRPIERIAADLRRLGRLLTQYQESFDLPHRAQRIKAVQLAYEDRLLEACAALGVEQQLQSAPRSQRPAEVMRIEHALRDAGLAV